ncbi:MAG: phage terminase small subunit [Asticcacaulis sp.]
MSRLSPAQRSFARKTAALVVAAAGAHLAAARPTSGPAATEYALLRAQMGEHLTELKALHSVELKIARKREILPEYTHHVRAVIDSAEKTGRALEDEVFIQIMVWVFDVGEYRDGLIMAAHALRFKVPMPSRFSSTVAAFVADTLGDAALSAVTLSGDKLPDFNPQILQHALDLTEGADMADQARAKLHKALGLLMARTAQVADKDTNGPAGLARAAREEAVTHLKRAYALHEKIGVKKELDALESALRRA